MIKSTAQVNKKLSSPFVKLHKGAGYFYFVYDDGTYFSTKSVMVNSLKQLTLAEWLEEGEEFINGVRIGNKC